MVKLNLPCLGGFVVVVTLFPTGVGAQTMGVVPAELPGMLNAAGRFHAIDNTRQGTAGTITGKLYASLVQAQSQGASKSGLTRGKKIAIGAAIGGGVGIVVGEYWLGRGLDMPHGPDMLLGAGIGAGLGALIAWATTGNESDVSQSKSSVSVVPVLSPSHKSLLVTLALR